MVDVLVVAILAALVRFDALVGVYPGLGTFIFACVVIITMLAAMSFDPPIMGPKPAEQLEKQRD